MWPFTCIDTFNHLNYVGLFYWQKIKKFKVLETGRD